MVLTHTAILTNLNSNTQCLIDQIKAGSLNDVFKGLKTKKGVVFSTAVISHFIEEEEKHDVKPLTAKSQQTLKTMSSGEQKKALLDYLLEQSPDYMVLVNPYDNLDSKSQAYLKKRLESIASKTLIIQLSNRIEDILPFILRFGRLKGSELHIYGNKADCLKESQSIDKPFLGQIPRPLNKGFKNLNELVAFNNVSVRFGEKQVLHNITWTIKPGEFWQLIGPNGSGKTTLLTMITGESHKGYGQNLKLFGQQKGSGESIWDIKRNIGYFTPSLIANFKSYQSLEHMLLSGLYDSIGLYVKPTKAELQLAQDWLRLLGMQHRQGVYFHQLSEGEKRLLMTARAMIKHPPLLILDEPTVGLDSSSAQLFVTLVNKIAEESESALIYVSHRSEIGLKPKLLYELKKTPLGSEGVRKVV
ncbi:MAG: ATP-binding cassette domain-containing protein [Croceitalea sp.]|nr:ATP-binding cassette domain-containing protein [Croceitalea sp.]